MEQHTEMEICSRMFLWNYNQAEPRTHSATENQMREQSPLQHTADDSSSPLENSAGACLLAGANSHPFIPLLFWLAFFLTPS